MTGCDRRCRMFFYVLRNKTLSESLPCPDQKGKGMKRECEGQLTLEDVFGINLEASHNAGSNRRKSGHSEGTGNKGAEAVESPRPAAIAPPASIKEDVTETAGDPVSGLPVPEVCEAENMPENMPSLPEEVMEAVKRKTLFPGDRVLIEEAIQKSGDGNETYVLVVSAFTDTDEWTACEDGSSVRFTRGYLLIRKAGKTKHFAWEPVFRYICRIVKEKQWLTDAERRKERKEQESTKKRRRKW